MKGANTSPSVKYGLHLKLPRYFQTFTPMSFHLFASKQGAHTLHQPRGVASAVRVRTTISPGQVSVNLGQPFLPCLASLAWHS